MSNIEDYEPVFNSKGEEEYYWRSELDNQEKHQIELDWSLIDVDWEHILY